MRRAKQALLVGGALAAALAPAGCGSSSKSGGDGKVSASAYVTHVCTAVSSWLHGIEGGATKIGAQLHSNSSPVVAKKALEGLVESTVASSEDVVASLRAAGVPDVPEGQKIASSLVGTFEHAATQLQPLRASAKALPTNPASFRASVERLGAALQSSLSGIGGGLTGLRSPDLQKAAAQSSACRTLGAA